MNIIWHNESFLLQDHTDDDVTIAKSVGFEFKEGWRTTDSNIVQELNRRVELLTWAQARLRELQAPQEEPQPVTPTPKHPTPPLKRNGTTWAAL